MTGKKPRTPSYKYSFRLNEEQNIRFNELLCKAGSEHNRSRFIVKRVFEEAFVVIKRDSSKRQFNFFSLLKTSSSVFSYICDSTPMDSWQEILLIYSVTVASIVEFKPAR